MRFVQVRLTLGCLLISAWSGTARADGGTLRLTRSEGNYQISVLTTPTPFRVGPVDVSVLVQDAITGEFIPNALVTVWLVLSDHQPGEALCYAATDKAATNKLLKAAVFNLPKPGRWEVKVTVEGEQGSATVHFELEAAQRVPGWLMIWPWVSWPAPAILLFLIHQALVRRRHRQPA